MAKFLPEEYYDRFLSNVSKMATPSASQCIFFNSIQLLMDAERFFVVTVRGLMPLESKPGLISMRAGNPNPSTFPFTSIQLTARSPTDPTKSEILTIDQEELVTALQYGPTAGMPSLLEWIWGLQEFAHGRKRGEGWRPSVGSGSQDVIYKVCGT